MSETKASQPAKKLSASEFYAARDAFDRNRVDTISVWQKTVDEAQACGLTVKCEGQNVAGALLYDGEKMIAPPNAIKAEEKVAEKAKPAKE